MQISTRWLLPLPPQVHIWSVDDGALVKSYDCAGSVFEVSWNRSGDKLAASLGDKSVAVLELRM